MLLDLLATNTLPRHAGPQPWVKIALRKDVVGEMGNLLEPEIGVELDALGGDRSDGIVQVNIAEPDGRVNVLNDQLQGRILALAVTKVQKFFDAVAVLDFNTIDAFPICRGPVLGLNKALTEDVIQDVLEVDELVVHERVELDELSGRLLAA